MKRYIRSSDAYNGGWTEEYDRELGTVSPKFTLNGLGDIVITGDALGYQGTIDIIGPINRFPQRLLKYIRNIYLHRFDDDGTPVYRVELMTDEDHLFKENYDRFYSKIYPVIKRAGFTIIDN